jgi:hypothetical protein
MSEQPQTMLVLIGSEMVPRNIDHFEEHLWRGMTEHRIQRIPIPVLLDGETLKRIPGGFQVLRKGEF